MSSPADVARGVFESLFAGDYSVFDKHPGLAALREHFPPMRVAFPDFRAELKQQLVDGNRVAFQWIFRGTHDGPLLGVAPTGRTVQFQNLSISRVEDGRIVQYNSEVGWLTLLGQLGVVQRLAEAATESAP
ncbi:MAG TPA: ester cyclase [Gemmatimonadaceae bacterium]|nr:ester cyclase [Gemmatimonadaceae bacterium]